MKLVFLRLLFVIGSTGLRNGEVARTDERYPSLDINNLRNSGTWNGSGQWKGWYSIACRYNGVYYTCPGYLLRGIAIVTNILYLRRAWPYLSVLVARAGMMLIDKDRFGGIYYGFMNFHRGFAYMIQVVI